MENKDISSEEKLDTLLYELRVQTTILEKIKNWIVFFGILVICGLVLSFCSALLS